MKFFSKKKTPKTYSTLHNRAVNAFNKSSLILVWAAVLNVAGVLFGVLRKPSNYAMCLGCNNALFRLVEANLDPASAEVGIAFINIGIALVFSAFMIYIGIFSRKAKLPYILIGAGFYFADTILTFIFFYSESLTTYLIAIFCHVVIICFIFISIFEYYNVIYIEKKYKGFTYNKKTKLMEKAKVTEEDEHKYDFLSK